MKLILQLLLSLGFSLWFAGSASAQLSCTPLNQPALMALFSDNAGNSSITPANIRSLVCSLMGSGSGTTVPNWNIGDIPVYGNSGLAGNTSGAYLVDSGGALTGLLACNAVGDGVANDTVALTKCDSSAMAINGSIILTKTYRVSGPLTLTSPIFFMPNASLKPDAGSVITLNGAVWAPDTAQIFTGGGATAVLTPGSSRVSVAWWGATPSAGDAAPGFTAAIKSNRRIVCPPGNYTFNSVKPTRPLGTLNYTSVYITGVTNFELSCVGANILPGSGLAASVPSNGAYGLFEVDGNSTDFWIHGFQFGGDYHSATKQNTAFAVFNAQRFKISDIDLYGNWGGLGNAFVGDWMVNGVYENIKMANVGICFDFAFMINVTFDKIQAHGSDGASGPGFKCLGILNDTPNLGTNGTGVTITDTAGIQFVNSDVSNFGATGGDFVPVVLNAGHDIHFANNTWHDNLGAAGNQSSVMTIRYVGGSVPFNSSGVPPSFITVTGDIFKSNGTSVGLPVIKMNCTAVTNSDACGPVNLTGNQFQTDSVGAFTIIATDSLTGIAVPGWATAGNFWGFAQVGAQIAKIMDSFSYQLGAIPGSRVVYPWATAYAGGGATVYTWMGTANASEAAINGLIPNTGGVIRRLSVVVTPALTSTHTVTATFRDVSTDTSVTCTATSTGSACSDFTDLSFIDGGGVSNVSVKITSDGTCPAENVLLGIEYDTVN